MLSRTQTCPSTNTWAFTSISTWAAFRCLSVFLLEARSQPELSAYLQSWATTRLLPSTSLGTRKTSRLFMDSTDRVDEAPSNNVLRQFSPSIKSRQPFDVGSPQRPREEQSCPLVAESLVQCESAPNNPRTLSVKNIRKSMVLQPGASPATAKTEASLSQRSSKHNKPSVFGLFNAKEPSSEALREYEETLKKQQNQGKGKVSAVGMPMTTVAKLPAKVPKVNSKWDGLPENVKSKQGARKGLKWQKSVSDSRISEAKHATSSPSYPESLVQSNASLLSSTSVASTQSSIHDFAFPKTPTSKESTFSNEKLDAQRDQVSVTNISSSKNSPDSAIEDLQFSTSFPFPSILNNPVVYDAKPPNTLRGAEAQPTGMSPHNNLHSHSRSSERSRGIFEKMRPKKIFSLNKTRATTHSPN